MSSFAIVTDYLTDLFEKEILVNTVVFGSLDDKYLGKNDIYPLVHITPTKTTYSLDDTGFNFIHFNYEIAVVDIRYQGQSFGNANGNLLYNLNTCNQIIVNALSKIRSGNTSDDIYLESVTDADPLMFQDIHLLDGWVFNIEFTIPNNYSQC